MEDDDTYSCVDALDGDCTGLFTHGQFTHSRPFGVFYSLSYSIKVDFGYLVVSSY